MLKLNTEHITKGTLSGINIGEQLPHAERRRNFVMITELGGKNRGGKSGKRRQANTEQGKDWMVEAFNIFA